MLHAAKSEVHGVLLLENRIEGFTLLVSFWKSLYRDGTETARAWFSRLLPLQASSDPELEHEVALAEIELLMELGQHEAALKAVTEAIAQLKSTTECGEQFCLQSRFVTDRMLDIAHRLQLLVLKGRILCHGGKSSKAFSIAVRAVATAQRLRVIPVLVEAVALFGKVLNGLSEFAGCKNLVEATLPMVSKSSGHS